MKINWKKVLLVGNRWHKNLWDELILIWNIKLLLKQNKKIYIACSNKKWLENFHKQFFDTSDITYIQELPKGFRSFFKFFKKLWDIKYYFKIDSILIWWGEILTEETPFSYWYWILSIWTVMFFKKLYLSWWIQIPKKIRNKVAFSLLTKLAKKIYVRDYDLIGNKKLKDKIEFFPDTSLFVYDDVNLQNYNWHYKTQQKKYIVVNVNKKAENFFQEVEIIVDNYYRKDYIVYFAWICKSPKDNDIIYYHKLKKKYNSIRLLDYEKNFWNFIKILADAEKIFTTRLHLFLVSFYLWKKVNSFVYEKKVEKMKDVLLKINNKSKL